MPTIRKDKPVSNNKPASPHAVKESQMERAEFMSTVWQVEADADVPMEAILEPGYWSHVAMSKGISIGDEFKVRRTDGAWWAWLLVVDCGGNWVKVHALARHEFEVEDPAKRNLTKGFHVEWQGIKNKHVVVREDDSAIVAKGFKRRPEAEIAMQQHVSALML